jgi:hypothetical protein
MPRRRRRVVDAMSDNIEEDEDATQRQEDVDAVDADEDEDQQPRPPRRTVGRSGQGESSNMAAARGALDPERDDDAQDETPPVFDEATLGNKPLSRHDGQKLQGMASDWNMIGSNLKDHAFSLLTEISAAVAEYPEDSTAQKVVTAHPPLSSHAQRWDLSYRN